MITLSVRALIYLAIATALILWLLGRLNRRFADLRWQHRTIVTLTLLKANAPIEIEEIVERCRLGHTSVIVALFELHRSGLVDRQEAIMAAEINPPYRGQRRAARFTVAISDDPGRRDALIRALEQDVRRRYV